MILLRMDGDVFPVRDYEQPLFQQNGATQVLTIRADDPADIIRIDPEAIAVVSGRLPREVICRLRRCRIILRLGTGYDKIDVAAATERGILVTFVPDYCFHDVAEHAILLLLAAARRLPAFTRSMTEGTWMNVRRSAGPRRLSGKTLGIIGFGRIGREIGRIAAAMGLQIIVHDALPNARTEYPFTYVPLPQLLSTADFISINCPLTPATTGLIGAAEISQMKPDVILINVARGAICDEQALARALRSGRIAAAGIDVYEQIKIFSQPDQEPFDGPYHGLANVVLTPHCASLSQESWRECVEKTAAQLQAFQRGEIPANCVNPQVRPVQGG